MILKRIPSTPVARPVAFYDCRQGALTTPDGKSTRVAAPDGPTAILGALTREGGLSTVAGVVYLVGGATVDDAPDPDWYKAAAGDGWHIEYRHDATPARRSATYTRGPLRVQIRHSAAWFGAERKVPAMRSAFRVLSGRLEMLFGSGVLLGSPAQTGLSLLERSLPFGAEYESMPDELQRHIHAWSPQARREVFSFAGSAETVPGFCYYDARLAYGACVRHVPTGELSHVQAATSGGELEIARHTRGIYLAEWQVPQNWSHIGILPERPERSDGQWTWPHEPGSWHRGWIWAPALDLAREQGWRVRVREGWEWLPRTNRGADPLRGWADKLLLLYQESTPRRYGEAIAPLVRSALRAMLLSPIGSFHRRETREWRIIPVGAPDDYPITYPRELTPWGWQIELPRALSAERSKWSHPEWSAWIWATQYARMTGRMLACWPADLLGCNTDAIYTARPYLNWQDTGHVGDYRLKGRIVDSVPAPRSLAALHELATESEQRVTA